MWDRERKTWVVVFLANVLLNTVTASPIYVPQFIPGSTGRNIRHLPCVSRRTGETGVCMFAFTCAKANGTHLGTCIDRFYFGSCCKIDEEPDIFPQDNSIDDGSPARPFVTTHGPIESNDIPEYFSRPKPINEKKPTGTYSTEETTSMYTTQSIRTQPTTVKETTKVATKKPVATTTQRPTTLEISTRPLSTAQTFAETTKFVTKKPIHSTTTHKPTYSSSYKPTHSSSYKPPHSSSYKPAHSTVHRPTNATTPKPLQSTVDRTTESTTSKTVITTTQRITPITRFPPRNATTARPLTHATTKKPTISTKKPVISSSTKRPTATTKKPITPSKRPPPSTTIRPPVNTTLSTLSSTTTTKPLLTSIKRPTIATTTENVAFSAVTKPVSSTTETVITQKFTTIATTRPTQKVKPTTVRTTTSKPLTTPKPLTTTPKPLTTTPKPLTNTPKPLTTVPRPKPTKISTTTPSLISKPDYATTTEKTGSLSSINVTTVAITKPKPTIESTKPTKPSSKPTSKPISKPTVKPTIKPISKPSSTTSTTLLSSTVTNVSFASSSSIDTTTTTPAYVTSTKVSIVNQTFGETSHTTYTPGLVTWTSSSDDTTTKNPETFSTTTTQLDQTESEWTPITTPDGWIMIQSPTTKKPQTVEDTTDKLVPESTSQFSTSAKPTTETGTEHEVTKRPTILTTLSSIASVTIDTELPVPMETLNMSDYKQVCGRRLFPESRIVGGNRSSFGKWPWQISLRQWRTSTYLHKCGAALLNENWAITAAHCVENVPPSDLLLRIGEHDLANEDEPYGYQERRVQIVASHPQFDPRTFEYDLALLRFYEPLLPFQPNVLPICLPDDDESYVGRTAYVTGWGRLYDEGPLPSVLQEVAVPVINNTMCEVMYRNAGYIEHIPHIFICAGWRNGEYDSCEGDSGGPMVIQRARDKRWILAGVISWGIGCAVPNQPGVYTRISEFREWINQILQF